MTQKLKVIDCEFNRHKSVDCWVCGLSVLRKLRTVGHCPYFARLKDIQRLKRIIGQLSEVRS